MHSSRHFCTNAFDCSLMQSLIHASILLCFTPLFINASICVVPHPSICSPIRSLPHSFVASLPCAQAINDSPIDVIMHTCLQCITCLFTHPFPFSLHPSLNFPNMRNHKRMLPLLRACCHSLTSSFVHAAIYVLMHPIPHSRGLFFIHPFLIHSVHPYRAHTLALSFFRARSHALISAFLHSPTCVLGHQPVSSFIHP